MFNYNSFIFVLSVACSAYCTNSPPEIVDDISPEFKQPNQVGYLNCSVINLEAPAVLQWIKMETPSGNPLLISDGENIKINVIVDGQRKYEVVKTSSNNVDQYQLVIRGLTDVDSGDYKCQIYLPNQNYLDWPSKIGHLTVL